jgi:hypothetical protein
MVPLWRLHPSLYWIRYSWSGSTIILYCTNLSVRWNTLFRDQISLCQHVIYYSVQAGELALKVVTPLIHDFHFKHKLKPTNFKTSNLSNYYFILYFLCFYPTPLTSHHAILRSARCFGTIFQMDGQTPWLEPFVHSVIYFTFVAVKYNSTDQ